MKKLIRLITFLYASPSRLEVFVIKIGSFADISCHFTMSLYNEYFRIRKMHNVVIPTGITQKIFSTPFRGKTGRFRLRKFHYLWNLAVRIRRSKA